MNRHFILLFNIVVATLCLNAAPTATTLASESEETLYLVATGDTYSGAGKLTDFLDNKSVAYQQVEPSQLETHNHALRIVIIAGMNELQDFGEILSLVLIEEERIWLSEPGNNAIYIKQNVWTDNQEVMVIAGSSPETAIDGLDYYLDQWLSTLASWFGFSLTSEELYGY